MVYDCRLIDAAANFPRTQVDVLSGEALSSSPAEPATLIGLSCWSTPVTQGDLADAMSTLQEGARGGYLAGEVTELSGEGRDPLRKDRVPIALSGRVFCKVDARESAIEEGDLLTTSETVGHAMKATDGSRAFGAVIGKALGSLKSGIGMIPVLVNLQ